MPWRSSIIAKVQRALRTATAAPAPPRLLAGVWGAKGWGSRLHTHHGIVVDCLSSCERRNSTTDGITETRLD